MENPQVPGSWAACPPGLPHTSAHSLDCFLTLLLPLPVPRAPGTVGHQPCSLQASFPHPPPGSAGHTEPCHGTWPPHRPQHSSGACCLEGSAYQHALSGKVPVFKKPGNQGDASPPPCTGGCASCFPLTASPSGTHTWPRSVPATSAVHLCLLRWCEPSQSRGYLSPFSVSAPGTGPGTRQAENTCGPCPNLASPQTLREESAPAHNIPRKCSRQQNARRGLLWPVWTQARGPPLQGFPSCLLRPRWPRLSPLSPADRFRIRAIPQLGNHCGGSLP